MLKVKSKQLTLVTVYQDHKKAIPAYFVSLYSPFLHSGDGISAECRSSDTHVPCFQRCYETTRFLPVSALRARFTTSECPLRVNITARPASTAGSIMEEIITRQRFSFAARLTRAPLGEEKRCRPAGATCTLGRFLLVAPSKAR